LFKNKPVLVVFNKCDIKTVGQLSQDKQDMIRKWVEENQLETMEISTLERIGVEEAKARAC